MGQDLPITSFALLGLFTFSAGDRPQRLTGYELKQLADATLRFYWVAPAMSQVYKELGRLAEHGLVSPSEDDRGTTYSITSAGRSALETWMRETEPGFSVLKHPIALRLLLGHVVDPGATLDMLHNHLTALDRERDALVEVRESLRGADGPGETFRHPSLVADWGLDYFAHERVIVEDLIRRISEDT
jgi:DNA-binding PadR family transcriptional regulator